MSNPSAYQSVMATVQQRNPHQTEFIQAVQEFVEAVYEYAAQHQAYLDAKILDRLIEPERMIVFRIPWQDDQGVIQINRGFRVQMNSALGPYKGGLRFHPSVNLSILKFLAFEQTFKNALTNLPLGSGKGGANFDPKGKSDSEIMRFCQSFMSELYRHIGQYTDVPAGDIGVGAREIGFMFGQYKRLANAFEGVLTGKSYGWGGSLIRPEATGYGCVYFSQYALAHHNQDIKGKRIVISGSGNVAQYTAEKLIQLGAVVVALSDSSGYIYDKQGLDEEKLAYIKDIKNVQRQRIERYAAKYPSVTFQAGAAPWGVPCDFAYPCATQNELTLTDAKVLVKNGCKGIFEGANMPLTLEATHYVQQNGLLFTPGKASNAGGVATSGLEMSQNAQRLSWSREEVNSYLENIMQSIHTSCVTFSNTPSGGVVDYVKGANIAGFKRVADAMLDQGFV